MLSLVVPVFNEEESLPFFYKELIGFLTSKKIDYEIIFIDDGSTDKSLVFLKEAALKNKKIRLFSFRKNQGKAEALTLGFQKAKGDYVATLDADLQDKPSEIEKLLKEAKEGWEVVCGWRKNRKDSLSKILASKFFNFSGAFFWGLRLHDYNCGLKVYTQDAAKSIRLYGGMHRFIPLLVYQAGFSVSEVPVVHQKRKYGESKYGFSKVWKDLPDMFTMLFLGKYSKRPLHFFGVIGFISLFLGGAILIYLTLGKILFGQGIGDRPILFLGILLVLTGFQVFFTGLLADLILNVSHRSENNLSSITNLLKYSSEKI